jgi:membrane associated rhomboid family serine protease
MSDPAPRPGPAAAPPFRMVPVTTGIFLVAAALFAATAGMFGEDAARQAIEGAAGSAARIWAGHWWLLLTSSLAHANLLHVAFNLYWLRIFGPVVEARLGLVRFGGFAAAAAFVAAAAQLAASGQTGIGLSGVIYALFGFIWLAGLRPVPGTAVLRPGIRNFFLIWFVACIALDHFSILPIANAAHAGGLAFGALVGMVAAGLRPRLAGAGAFALVCLAFFPVIRCPWQADWNGWAAAENYQAGRLSEALVFSRRAIAQTPQQPWLWWNHALILEQLGLDREAAEARSRALQLRRDEGQSLPPDPPDPPPP